MRFATCTAASKGLASSTNCEHSARKRTTPFESGKPNSISARSCRECGLWFVVCRLMVLVRDPTFREVQVHELPSLLRHGIGRNFAVRQSAGITESQLLRTPRRCNKAQWLWRLRSDVENRDPRRYLRPSTLG